MFAVDLLLRCELTTRKPKHEMVCNNKVNPDLSLLHPFRILKGGAC